MNKKDVKKFDGLFASEIYIECFSRLLKKYYEVDTIYFPKENDLTDSEKMVIYYIPIFYNLIYEYCLLNVSLGYTPDMCLIKYDNLYYRLYDNGEGFTACNEKYNKNYEIISYEQLLTLIKPKGLLRFRKFKEKLRIRKK